MRKFTAIFLLIILVINTLGYFGVFKVLQYNAQKEMRLSLLNNTPAKYITELSFSLYNTYIIDWERTGKEFNYQNKMYDVVRCDTIMGVVHITCISDTREDELNNLAVLAIEKQTDNNQTPIGKAMNNLLKAFFSITVVPTQNTQLYFNIALVAHNFRHKSVDLLVYSTELLHPPCFIN